MQVQRWLAVTSVCMLLSATGVATAGDWAQFLGPNRNAKSSETGLLEKWPENGPPQLWRTELGRGFGGAAIRDGRVFVLDRIFKEADVLRCLDLKTGEEQWRYRYEAPGRVSVGGSRSTPTVTEDHVYTVGGFGHVHCISRKTHKPVWKLDLDETFKEASLKWGYAQSPLVYKDTLIVSPANKKAPGLVALERDTGEVVWESEPFGGDFYCSPVLRTVAGAQGVMITTQHDTFFIDPDTGQTLWRYEGYDVSWSIPAPTVLPDGHRVFVTGGYGAGSVMLRVEKQGDGYNVEELFQLESGAQVHPAIYHEGYLYANINENATLGGKQKQQNGGLACIDPEAGRILWRTGAKPNFNRGNVLFADGKLIVLHGQTGELYLVEPDPEKFKPVSSFLALDQDGKRNNKVWAPMALARGRLIVRDQYEMKCFDLRPQRTARAE